MPLNLRHARNAAKGSKWQIAMYSRDALADWEAFDAESIPTKGIKLPTLFEDSLRSATAAAESSNQNDASPSLRILELGCGSGALVHRLAAEGHDVVGVDANEDAISIAKQRQHAKSGSSMFVAGDATTFRSTPPFDFCILQLLLSIVGDATNRKRTLVTAYESLRSGGWVYLSCSGVSDGINPNYRKLYEQDYPATGERHTYLSRNANGTVLYVTHHFSVDELEILLKGAGFADIVVEEVQEASSRRPEEVANFLYAVARKP